MTGYSGTPLPRKLGIKAGYRVGLLAAPDGLVDKLAPLPDAVRLASSLRGKQAFDVILFFVSDQKRLERDLQRVIARLEIAGGLWICWPKQASGVPTDLNREVVRPLGLAAGLVDNKVCAVDETWSGLRFVYRLRDR